MSELPGEFRILGSLRNIQIIATGQGVRIAGFLKALYGGSRWRKMNSLAVIEDEYGYFGNAEIHWYEAHGIGKVRWKVKKHLESR